MSSKCENCMREKNTQREESKNICSTDFGINEKKWDKIYAVMKVNPAAARAQLPPSIIAAVSSLVCICRIYIVS